jgi:Xaa-Pro aminopeptidase
MTHSAWLSLEQRLEHPLTHAAHILAQLRASKDAEELTCMIAAQRIAEKALDEVLGLLRPGLTEKQVAAELVYRMYKYGGEANSFDPIVIAGKKTSMPHGVPGDEVIQAGDFVTMDFGTMCGGYCSDMTRTVAIGHATEEMKKVYATVLEAQLAGIAAAKPGVAGRDIDKAARDVIEKAGYGPYFGHSFGHSLGLEIHEAPNASPANSQPMPAGAVISAEPGIYLPGQFGVRIEDVLWLRSGGAENITKAPKSLIIL